MSLALNAPEGRLLVAVSGGPDSTALLLALRESGREVVAAHYDHALREGSDAVARQVGELCARLDVQLITGRRGEPLAKGSIQAAARELRYAFLDRARVEVDADWVVTAHTADDLVEGAVLHLLRGCGIAGLRGMPARRDRYVRPMLDVWRKDVGEFLERRGAVAHQDPSNLDERFARVRVRRFLLPALERDRPGIIRLFHAAAVAAARLQEAAEREPAKVEVLKRLYADAGGRQPGLSRAHVEAMLKLAEGGRGGRGVDLPGGLRFRIVGGLMQVIPSQRPSPVAANLTVHGCSGCEEGGAVHLRDGFHLRLGHRRPGLRMRPLGGRGSRKLQDIFVDARVPREDRDGWPLVFAGEKLAWVPGLAVDAELVSPEGLPAQHVTVTPMPALPSRKVARLETPLAPGARGAHHLENLS
jgi:tRNA(Ile)-lysidine synthetase-like protein